MTQENIDSSLSPQMPELGDPGDIARELIRRDQWRARILAVLSLIFWLLGTAGMLLLIIGLDRMVIYLRTSVIASATQPWSPVERQQMFWGTSLIHHSIPWVGGSIIGLMLAAVFTVLLVFSSRKATLSQINISLKQISEQLKEMREGETPERTRAARSG